MSYIRTKDGKIFDLENKKVSSWEYIDNDTAINEYGVEGAFYTIYYFDENEGCYSEYDDKGGHSCDFIDEKNIIVQANTIEKLCDGFYLDLGGEFNDIYLRRKDKFEILKELAFDYMRKDIKVILYAFIKTDEGLIYVAKMNDKGELKLI